MPGADDFDELMQFQRQLASSVVRENEMELQMRMLEVIDSLVKDKNKQVQKAKILTVAEMEGIAEDQAARILKSLEDLGYVKQAAGYYRKT
jgi:ribosomal protein S25